MSGMRKATWQERIILLLFRFSGIIIAAVSISLSIIMDKTNLMETIVKNSETLSVTGVAIAAFLFTVQSILIALPHENPFVKAIRKEGHYMRYLHVFCRRAQIVFMLWLLPMLYMGEETTCLNHIATAGYLFALTFSIWAMWLMTRILIITEKHS